SVAGSAAEAFENLEGRAEDAGGLAILSWRLLRLDGDRWAREMGELCRGRGIAILLLDELGGDAERDGRGATGCRDVLSKPLRSRRLRDSLERLAADTPRQSIPVPPPRLSSGEERILLVEDNPVNRDVALGLLHFLGLDADVAENGRRALDAVQSRPYDILLMDLQMPDMDGFEATRRIRETLPPDAQPFILAMTAHAVAGYRERCLAAGMDGYLAKPIDKRRLAAALAEARRSKGAGE
ncbi:MAG: response regulator, partial [Acidobacteriota bacterium]